jgi:hypothetical protein
MIDMEMAVDDQVDIIQGCPGLHELPEGSWSCVKQELMSASLKHDTG